MDDVTGATERSRTRPVEWKYVWRGGLIGLISGAANAGAVSIAIHSSVWLGVFIILEGGRAAVVGVAAGIITSLLIWALSLGGHVSQPWAISGAVISGLLYGAAWLSQVSGFVGEAQGTVLTIGTAEG